MKVKFGFSFKILPGNEEKYAILQARSIRQFGGTHKNCPIFAMLPIYAEGKLNPESVAALDKLGVEIVTFDYYSSNQVIYYTTKSMAAGAAESYAIGKVEQLIYSDVESLFLNDPSLMMLNKNKKLGIRPVDIRNIGSVWDEPINDFWSSVYNLLRVNQRNIFPVISTVDSVKLRAYFNVCLMTVKPEHGLLQKWSSNLARLRDNPVWNKFFERDDIYRVFLHQAIMAATILSALNEDEIEQYPVQVNFPLYSYPRHPHKPEWINDLITCRLDLLGTDDCWKTWLPMRDPVKSWLFSSLDELDIALPE